MKSEWAGVSLSRGIENNCADDVVEALCNLEDGTCDAAELIPVLEQVIATDQFWFFDDNGSGGFPHPTGEPCSFRESAQKAISNIRQNQQFASRAPIAQLLKSLDTNDVSVALRQLAEGDCADALVVPILEKIAAKNEYKSYSYIGGYDPPVFLGDAARAAMRRINDNVNGGIPEGAKCHFCGSVPAVTTINRTNYDAFEAPIPFFKSHKLEGDADLWECPVCAAFFLWHRRSSRSGSLPKVTETLTRLSQDDSVFLRNKLYPLEHSTEDSAAMGVRVSEPPELARDFAAFFVRRKLGIE